MKIALETAGSDKDERTSTRCNSRANILWVSFSPEHNVFLWYKLSLMLAQCINRELFTSTVSKEDGDTKSSEWKIRWVIDWSGKGVDRKDDDIDFANKSFLEIPPGLHKAHQVANWSQSWKGMICYYSFFFIQTVNIFTSDRYQYISQYQYQLSISTKEWTCFKWWYSKKKEELSAKAASPPAVLEVGQQWPVGKGQKKMLYFGGWMLR